MYRNLSTNKENILRCKVIRQINLKLTKKKNKINEIILMLLE